ncbi:MAG: hypothetical protein AABW92_02920 [Nanoarchaeota archaeon]
MTYKISNLTERIDAVADKYIRKDAEGSPLTAMGYLRKQDSWPQERGGAYVWKFLHEEAPDFGSTDYSVFEYCPNPTKSTTKKHEGFYLQFDFIGNDLESALNQLDSHLSRIPQKE